MLGLQRREIQRGEIRRLRGPVMDPQSRSLEQFCLCSGGPPRRGTGGGNGRAASKRKRVAREDEAAADVSQLNYLQPSGGRRHMESELFASIPLSGPPSHSTVLEVQRLWGAKFIFPAADQRLLGSLPVARATYPEEKISQYCGEKASGSEIVPSLPEEKISQNCGEKASGSEIVPSLASLPEELVEKIVSSMPFPNVMHARMLNKSWASKFFDGPDAKAFQDQVKTASSGWQHYCPVILNIEKEWLVGYDRRTNRWHKVSVAFARDMISHWCSPRNLRGAGSLMCGVFKCQIFVINVVLRTCVWLRPRPHMEFPHEVHLLPIGSDAYRALLITKGKNAPTEVCCQIYDSRTKSWSVLKSTVNSGLLFISSAYIEGVIYFMEYGSHDVPDKLKLLSYNMETGAWATISHPFGRMIHEIETYELLICQSQVMIVLHLHSNCRWRDPARTTVRKTLLVYKLDPSTLKITLVACGPPETLCAPSALFVSDNECIYFGNPQVERSSVVELDVRTQKWRVLPPPTYVDGGYHNRWLTFSFQPGLNPFVQV